MKRIIGDIKDIVFKTERNLCCEYLLESPREVTNIHNICFLA